MTGETFPAVLEQLYAERFTGPVIVQFGEGVPSVVEFPQPAKQIRLAKRPRPRVDLAQPLDSRP